MHFPLDCWAFRWWYWAFRLFKKICLKEVERGQERGIPHNDFLSKCSQSRLGQTKAKSQETPFRCPMWEAGSQVIELSSAASLRAHQQEPGLEAEMAHDHRQSDWNVSILSCALTFYTIPTFSAFLLYLWAISVSFSSWNAYSGACLYFLILKALINAWNRLAT